MCSQRANIGNCDFSNSKIIFRTVMFLVSCITMIKNTLSAPGFIDTNLANHQLIISRYILITIGKGIE